MRLLLAEDEKSLPKVIIVILQKTITLLMPKLDGISVLKKIRAQGNTVPVLMKKEDIRHIFDHFYRGDKSRNSQTGGYGIGTSIAKVIVEAHKGNIYAESSDGHSLTITAVFSVK